MFSEKRHFLRRVLETSESLSIPRASGDLHVALRYNARARRYSLRIPSATGDPVLTIPRGGSSATAKRFLEDHADWLEERLRGRPQDVPFVDGAMIPIRGVPHRITALSAIRGNVRRVEKGEHSVMEVPGGAAHMARRLTDWLKKEARADLEAACTHHADNLGTCYEKLTIRDQKTRWGSCSTGGVLSFSWRLILAPPDVLDYVAAHEVAHLLEMNHKPQFWALVRKTCPQMDEPKRWLRENGANLHHFGVKK